ncbi:MAG: ABC transporter ATP-binding protein [Candidatus Bathyarchaeia archaeon]
MKLLEIRGLKTYFFMSTGTVRAVDGVDFSMEDKQMVGIVGESGCGKSVTALSVMSLVPNPPGRIVAGEIIFEGEDLLKKTDEEMQKIRGGRIAMSFQDPMTYLNPVKRAGEQIAEAITLHQRVEKEEALEMAVESIELVGIPSPSERAKDYPHQLSGGMRQRIMIAMSMSCKPHLLIADEPTTALDVITQDEILELMENLKHELGTSTILITHDLAIVAGLCDRVAVMYAGNVVEYADTSPLYDDPLHPYTNGLMNSILRLDRGKERLESITGSVPDLVNPPPGCKFHPRCPHSMPLCSNQSPPLLDVGGHRLVACHLYGGT